MSGNTKAFKKTGRNVTVSRDDLLNTVIDRLMNYDSMDRSEKKKVLNPYRGPVYTKVEGGKTVQVPRQIQHLAIVKWVSMKKRAELSESPVQDPHSAHTRLTNRTRYDVRDPYVMNRELQHLGGEKSDIYDDDDPEDMDLVSLRRENIASRRAVGGVDIPDIRYGKGGSQGDLPRDMVDFARLMEREIQDMPYNTQEHEKGHIMPYEGKYLYNRDKPDRSLDYLTDDLARSKRAVRSSPTEYGKYKPILELDNEVLAESNTAETDGVEHYAPVNDRYQLERVDEAIDYSTNDCVSCRGDDEGYIHKQKLPNKDDYSQYVDEEAEYDDHLDYEREYIDSDEDEPVVDVKGRDLDRVENYEGDSDQTYKCLFLLLLLAVVVYIIYKKRKGEDLY